MRLLRNSDCATLGSLLALVQCQGSGPAEFHALGLRSGNALQSFQNLLNLSGANAV